MPTLTDPAEVLEIAFVVYVHALAEGDDATAARVRELVEGMGTQTFAAPGPPPRPHLKWKEETHRWIDPTTGAEHDHEGKPVEPATPPSQSPINPDPKIIAELKSFIQPREYKNASQSYDAIDIAKDMGVHPDEVKKGLKALEQGAKGGAASQPKTSAVPEPTPQPDLNKPQDGERNASPQGKVETEQSQVTEPKQTDVAISSHGLPPPALSHDNKLTPSTPAANVESKLPSPADMQKIVVDAFDPSKLNRGNEWKAEAARHEKWESLCDSIAPVLQKQLAEKGIKTRIVHGTYRLSNDKNGFDVHHWLETPDGTVIDPALPQYHEGVTAGQVKVYPKRPGWYRETDDDTLLPTEAAPDSLNHKTVTHSAETFADAGHNPPHPGLVYDEQSHRYHKPDSGEGYTPVASPSSTTDHPHVRSLLSRVREVPHVLVEKASGFVKNKYDSLSKRYGDKGAKAILTAMVLLTPVPVPGSSLIPIALAEAVKRVRGAINMAEEETD